MHEQSFIYMGVPKAQGRARFKNIRTKSGKSINIAYDPKDSAQYKSDLAVQILAQNPKFIPANVPVILKLVIILPRPKTHYNTKGNIKDSFKDLKHTSKPDLDNLEKAVKDAMKGIVWHDDSQVYKVDKEKLYTGEQQSPRALITVVAR